MSGADRPSIQRSRVPRKLVGTRRLLIATIGAATVNYAGCGDDTMTLVANLMAAPFMPPQGDGGASRAAAPAVSNLPGPAATEDAGVSDSKDEGASVPGSTP